jgi:release factor glutamine methyltransferase
MKAVNDILARSAEYLEERGVESPRRLAEQMLCGLLNLSRMDLYLGFDRPLNDEELAQCRSRLKRLGEGEPIQYIEGVVDFLGCSIEVGPSVLIPRPETEELASKIVEELKTRDLQGKRLWDICAGSGCLGIAVKKACPELEVVMSDISSDACRIAGKNAGNNRVEAKCRHGDLFAPFENETAHFIVSNPPYVSESEYRGLSRSVKGYEPEQALVGGADGLEVYRRIAKDLKKYLAPGGKAWMEIGFSQGNDIKVIFERAGFARLKVECDLSGHNRFFSLENE